MQLFNISTISKVNYIQEAYRNSPADFPFL